MAQQTLNNNVTFGEQRTKINENFTELYNLILGASNQLTVNSIAERDNLDANLGDQVFVTNDGDGKWALYKSTTSGVNSDYIKLSDPDLLNAVMTSSAIKASYESNPDTNAFTNSLKAAYDNAVTLSNNSVQKEAGKSLLSDSEITRLLSLVNYTHPANHPASIIIQDSSNRLVTDAEKATWNAKQNNIGFVPENPSNKGVANGYASLGSDGKVPTTQLPSFVDDVLEFPNLSGFPATGETGKIYVAIDTNKTYRWSGTVYTFITSGAVDSVAGKTGVVTLVKADVGLSNVDNTSDSNKPISTATQTALNNKQDTLVPGTNITIVGNTINASTNSSTMADWTALAFPINTDVYHNGTVWRSSSATLATEEPGISPKWVAKTEVVDGRISSVVLEETDFLYSFENYSIKYTSNVNSFNIMFSRDAERTWVTWVNPYGPLVHFHVFSNGEIMFCSTNKLFYTRDFVTVTEGQIFDHDGTPFTSNAIYQFFSASSAKNVIIFVDGVEMAVWSDYANSDPNFTARMWYTKDYGRTMKCALKFGTTLASGQSTACRHSHGTNFNRYNGKFYTNTGDAGNECKMIMSDYNVKTDIWTHTLLGSGQSLKFGNMTFDQIYTYVTTDYTQGGRQGVLKVNTNDIGDFSKYEYYIEVPTAEALIGFAEDSNGNKIITGDLFCTGEFYYAYGGNKFQKVLLTGLPGQALAPPSGFNANGDMYCMKQPSTIANPTLRNPLYNISKAMRKAGVYNFGKNPSLYNKDFRPLKVKDITSVTEQRVNDQLKFWRGTIEQYNAIPVKDPNTLYIYPKP